MLMRIHETWHDNVASCIDNPRIVSAEVRAYSGNARTFDQHVGHHEVAD
jgi:hypothetical protein